jgi:hypothetical protein
MNVKWVSGEHKHGSVQLLGEEDVARRAFNPAAIPLSGAKGMLYWHDQVYSQL